MGDLLGSFIRKVLNFVSCFCSPQTFSGKSNKVQPYDDFKETKMSYGGSRVEQFERYGHFYRPKTRNIIVQRQVKMIT